MRLVVDGRPVSVSPDASVLAGLRAAGAEVPTLCHDDRLTPAGSCRLCLVRADGAVVAACTTPARDGMDVRTDDPAVAADVRQVLLLIAERLPARALQRRSELATACDRLGVGADAFHGSDGPDLDESNPYLSFDPTLCIACGRCVRFCEQVQGTFALSLAGRGAATVAIAGDGGPWAQSPCVSCGGCTDTCPTGAIRVRSEVPVPSPEVTTTRTVCGYCGVGCSLDVHRAPDRPVTVTPAPDGPVNRGHACSKGRFAVDFVRSPERLTTPLVRRDGALVPASWDDALAVVAGRLRRIVAEHGPDAVAAVSSARATNEENYLVQKLMRAVIGTNNVDNCARVCHAPSATGLAAAFGLAGGTNPIDDLDRADVILLAGANPTEAHPVVGARLTQAVLRGARLVVIDPRRTALAELADVHLQPRPGSNVAVFHGLARILLDEGLVDQDFLEQRAAGLEQLRRVLAAYDADAVHEISGVAPPLLAAAARLYGAGRHAAIVYGLGVTEHAHGTDGVRTLANLAILRGAVGTLDGGGVMPLRGQNNVQGACDMGALPDRLPGYQAVTDPAVRARFAAAWGVAVPAAPGLRIPAMFDAALEGGVRALYLVGEDVAQTSPDIRHVRGALAACDLVVVQDPFFTETAALADVVLPSAVWLEKDGTFVNLDRRFQRVRPALAPPDGVRTDFDIVSSLAAALGADLGVRDPSEALDECAALAPLFAGISHERLDREGALHWPCRGAGDPGEARLYLDGFATPSGRARLAALPWRPSGEGPDRDHPFTLITGRRLQHYNAGTMTRRTPNAALTTGSTLDIGDDDARRLGVADGDLVEITSRRGRVIARAHPTPALAPGTVFLDFHFPGVLANLLTSAEADDTTSCPEYKVTAVQVRPVPG